MTEVQCSECNQKLKSCFKASVNSNILCNICQKKRESARTTHTPHTTNTTSSAKKKNANNYPKKSEKFKKACGFATSSDSSSKTHSNVAPPTNSSNTEQDKSRTTTTQERTNKKRKKSEKLKKACGLATSSDSSSKTHSNVAPPTNSSNTEQEEVLEEIFSVGDLARLVEREDMDKANGVIQPKKFIQVKVETFAPTGLTEEIHFSNAPEPNMANVLFRNPMKQLVQTVHLIAKGQRCNPRILVGPAGSGKSTTLYTIVQYALQQGFIVLYAELGQVLDHPENLAEQIVDRFYEVNDTEKLTNANITSRSLEQLVKSLHKCELPVLIALDQWNAISTVPKNSQNIVAKSFRITKPEMKWGTTFFAVSSSFDPYHENAFRDADFETNSIRCEVYTDSEWKTVICNAQHGKFLPNDKEIVDRLYVVTGRVPRLLMFAMQCHSQKEELVPGVKIKADGYYSSRVRKLLAKCGGDDEKKALDVAKVAAALVMNRDLTNLTDICLQSGLFYLSSEDSEGLQLYYPICPTLAKIFVREIAEDTGLKTILDVLGSDNATRWRGLEVAIASHFLQPRTVTVKAHKLMQTGSGMRKQLENWEPFEFSTGDLYHQQYMGDIGEEFLVPGRVYNCFPNHAVVDFVIFTKNSELVFLQVSESDYAAHTSKANDLYLNKFIASPTTSPSGSPSGSPAVSPTSLKKKTSVAGYYASKLPRTNAGVLMKKRIQTYIKNGTVNQHPDKVFYIYLSSKDSTITGNSQWRTHNNMVHLLGLHNMDSILGDGIGKNFITDHYKNKLQKQQEQQQQQRPTSTSTSTPLTKFFNKI